MTFELPVVVKAKDADLKSTRNSEITYHIVDGELRENFAIDNKTGTVTLRRPLDFEAVRVREKRAVSSILPIFLSVIARDQGEPSLSARATIVVYLIDVNDVAPEFERTDYSVEIPENLLGGTVIAEVSAIDRDGSAPNNMIVYRIQHGAADKFVIGSDSGQISIAQGASLDPDLTAPTTTEYTLSVVRTRDL